MGQRLGGVRVVDPSMRLRGRVAAARRSGKAVGAIPTRPGGAAARTGGPSARRAS